ncbi:packaged DNA stabilization protein [Lysobacter enzymogenes]|uniref:packaged DNA stabilization protein n=1 Tax=Lysobacter enzymogenes TaxID=69 RepID=UPI00089A8A85|nr:packaged DNA stabilization protein [Lysobacter enzymogenes]SDX52890.1 Phage stabilisation protein [Lysobacter enzymogenes]
MKWRPLQIVGGAYSDDTKPWTCQDAVNWLPLQAERPGARSDAIMRSAPGFRQFATTQNKPVRGSHDAEGLFLVVAGTTLYRINPDGTSTSLGSIPGVNRVSIAHNQIENGNEIVLVNGQSGYVFNTTTSTLVQITDEAFPGSYIVDFIDGYILGVDPFGRFWFTSDLTQATQYNSLDRADAEAAPDKIVSLMALGDLVAVWGERTLEFFQNTGATTGTFQRVSNLSQNIGCASPYARAQLDNSAYWLGDDGNVYRLQGTSPVRISTAAIEQAISGLNWNNAFATTFEDRGHKVFYLTFPDGNTWGYDVLSQEWHRRESHGMSRWRLSTLTRWRRRWYGGDMQNGKVYLLDWDEMTEDGQPLTSIRRTPVAHADGNPIIVDGFKVVFDVGRIPVGLSDHSCAISYSDDGGHNWSYPAIESIGAAGQYRQTVEVTQLGMAETRVWEIRVSSPGKRDVIAASWQAGVADS